MKIEGRRGEMKVWKGKNGRRKGVGKRRTRRRKKG